MPADLTPGVDVPAALLWDFDGTLVESEASWQVAEARLASDFGHTLSAEQHARLVGMALRDSVATILSLAGRPDVDPDAYADVLNGYALEDMAIAGPRFRPGARELLDAARAAGIACALVSASFASVLAHLTGTLKPGTFAVVVGGDQVERGKPDPEPYLTAVDRLGLTVRDCLVLEDSLPGTTSAERAGLATLGVPFEQQLLPGPRRAIVPTLDGLELAHVGRLWRELRDA